MASSHDLHQLRAPYSTELFTEDQLVSKTNPLLQFRAWFDDALKCDGIQEVNAVCLATATGDGLPSCRMVLLKEYSENGFKIYTNLESRKGVELRSNPHASLLFYWAPLHRQVRIEGTVQQVGEEEATRYFQSRPLSSQVSATISRQSRAVENRGELESDHKELLSTVEETGVSLSKPAHWGGFCIIPSVYEFWQGHSNRLHDRLVFTKDKDQWSLKRLAP